jgi:hypothetical protein
LPADKAASSYRFNNTPHIRESMHLTTIAWIVMNHSAEIELMLAIDIAEMRRSIQIGSQAAFSIERDSIKNVR